MTSATEIVWTRSEGPLSLIAEFAPIEVDTLNRAGRESTDQAFRQLAEAYRHSGIIGLLVPSLTYSDLSARNIVKETIQKITLRINAKGRDALKGLSLSYLEGRLSTIPLVLETLRKAGFAETRKGRCGTIMSDASGRIVIVPTGIPGHQTIPRNTMIQILKQATAPIPPPRQ